MNSASNQADSLSALSRHYHLALQRYLASDPRGDLDSARELGRRAVLLELDTLEMARIHEIAMAALVMPDCVSGTCPKDEVTRGCHLMDAKCF